VGLLPKRETIEVSGVRAGVEIDLVTHDALKFFSLMLKRNGYVLEQVYSPLVVLATPAYEELKEIGLRCVTRHHSHHYLGFAKTQWDLFTNEHPPRVKPLLDTFRVLLTGIHLMRTGMVEANLVVLNEMFRLPYVGELVERKIHGREQGVLTDLEGERFFAEYNRLAQELEKAAADSTLQEEPSAREQLNELLVRIRLGGVSPGVVRR
jgi:predicted nucleotidyltransferase